MEIYSSEFDALAGAQNEGMRCLETLRLHQNTLMALQPLVKSINDAALSGADLLSRARAAEATIDPAGDPQAAAAAAFKVPAGLVEMALQP